MSFPSGIYGGVFFLFRYNHPTKPNFFLHRIRKIPIFEIYKDVNINNNPMNMKTLQRFTGWNRLFLSLLLMASLLAPARMMGQEELTVHDSYSSSSDVPIHGEYCNYYLKAEFVIPATDLAVMDGASIINLKFYASQSFVLWGDANGGCDHSI